MKGFFFSCFASIHNCYKTAYSLSLFFWGFLEGSIVHTALCGHCADRNPGSHQHMGFIPCPSALLFQVPSWKMSLNLQYWALTEKEYGWIGVFTAVKFAFTVCQFDYSYLIFITLICSVNNIIYLSLGVLHLFDISLFIYKKSNKTKQKNPQCFLESFNDIYSLTFIIEQTNWGPFAM